MAVRQTADEAFNERYGGTSARQRDTSDTNRRVTGRGSTPQDTTRNVRTEVHRSTMPGAPRNESFVSSKRDIATEFNATYATRGIQPSYAAANTNEAPSKGRYQQPEQITRSTSSTEQQTKEMVEATPRRQKAFTRRQKIRKKVGVKSSLARVRVSAVNIWIWSWGIWTWLFFQLPFALASLFFLSLHQALHEMWLALEPAEDDKWYVSVGKSLANLVFDKVEQALAFFAKIWWGIDVNFLSPINFALLTYTVVLALGWFTLFLTWFIYKANLLNPTDGIGGGLKLGMFLLAFIGYATPIANIFPWFIFWTIAVWRYPK